MVVGFSVLVTLLTPRLYVASTRLQMARQSPIQLRLDENVLRVDDSDRNVNGSSSFLATQVAMLHSRDLAERVIRGQRLADNEAFIHPGPEGRACSRSGPSRACSVRAVGMPAPPRQTPIARWRAASVWRCSTATCAGCRCRTSADDLVESASAPAVLSAFLAAHTQAFMEANEEARRSIDDREEFWRGRSGKRKSGRAR
jgi:hypothetical protein